MTTAAMVASDGRDLERLALSFKLLGNSFRAYGSPLFGALLTTAADHPELLEITTTARPGQPGGFLLASAVHYDVLGDPSLPVAAYFPSATSSPRPPEEAFPVFRAYCLEHRDALTHTIGTLLAQTTTVDRAAYFVLLFARVAEMARAPLDLIEIGCSMGLLLPFDRYAYDFGSDGQLGQPGAKVMLKPTFIGTRPPIPKMFPEISSRVGIDLNVVDARDETERRWINAMLFPEWIAERARLNAAIDQFRARPERLIEDDALKAVPALLDEAKGVPCVFHSQCLFQWPQEARDALDAILREKSRARPIHRLAFEQPFDIPIAVMEAHWKRGESIPSTIEHTVYEGGDARTVKLAEADTFGHWLRWLA